ncbi:MAG: hypothetical protein KME43_15925 [Myxacorys chilensis ATA2-1-KO14]|jgi:hypothetical protein|nr:hypothetical protein [Myxacorys chilensis ATA2-1-KO14]
MMRALTQDEYETELKPIVEQLTIELKGDQILETYFTDKLLSRHIIYPCDTQIDDDLVFALADVMRSVHDPGLYVDFEGRTTYMNRRGLLETTPSSYYYVPTAQVEYAFNDEGIAQEFMDTERPSLFADRYILYSAHKRWVMVVEHGAHCALWGGDEALADLLTLKCSQIGRPIQEFLSFWKPDVPFMDAEFELGASYAWIVRLLIHVYGHEKAMSLLCESGF